MKTYFSNTCFLIALCGLLSACDNVYLENMVVNYTGDVVYTGTALPYKDLEVKVTDSLGNVHRKTTTDSKGHFELKTILKEINGNYYILVGDVLGQQKKIKFPGFGQETIDVGVVEIDKPSYKPIVKTFDPEENITASSIYMVGEVVDDQGHPILERGFVYSTMPSPTTASSKVVCSGTVGYFSSYITQISPADNTYYIRAYATNSEGTSYGEQIVVTPQRYEYLSLPIVVYGGYRYHVYRDMGSMNWYTAKDLCNNLSFGGFNDWYLPDRYELQAIAEAEIGGWTLQAKGDCFYGYYWSSSIYNSYSGECYYITVSGTSTGTDKTAGFYTVDNDSKSKSFRVRAVRRDKLE